MTVLGDGEAFFYRAAANGIGLFRDQSITIGGLFRSEIGS